MSNPALELSVDALLTPKRVPVQKGVIDPDPGFCLSLACIRRWDKDDDDNERMIPPVVLLLDWEGVDIGVG